MIKDFSGKKISILGGDMREIYLAWELINRGMDIALYGFEKLSNETIPVQIPEFNKNIFYNDLATSDAIILPMPGVKENGKVFSPFADETLKFDETIAIKLKKGIPIFVGVKNSFLNYLEQKYNLQIIPIADLDHVAIYNSIPTVEGALEIAMRELPITIHGSKSLVLGFGRVGISMARALKALGSHTTVAARNLAQIARAYETGHNVIHIAELKSIIKQNQIIINTIPALILNAELLTNISSGSLIIDLASSPGGTDFKEAERLGIKAILASGLPGKVAPETAGRILGKVYPDILIDYLTIKNGGAD